MNIANLSATFVSAPGGPPRGGGPLEDVSSLFGMSANDVAEKVRSGSSLEDVADQLGVTREDLYSALANGAPPQIRESGNLDATVAGIAAHKGPGPMPGGPGRPPGPGGPGGGRGVAGQSGVIGGSLTDAQTRLPVLAR